MAAAVTSPRGRCRAGHARSTPVEGTSPVKERPSRKRRSAPVEEITQVAPFLKTDANGVATVLGKPFTLDAGVVTGPLKDAPIS